MIVVSFDKFTDFRDELAARMARVREETVRVRVHRLECDPFSLLELTFTAVVHVQPPSIGADADLLRCVIKIGPYEAKSLDANECIKLAGRTQDMHAQELRNMGLDVRAGEYLDEER